MTTLEQDHRVSKRFLKWIASLTLPAFIFSNLFFTSPAEIFAQAFPISAPARFPEAFLKFPSELGKLETYLQPQDSSGRFFVYLIQDAHESLAAQENIFKTLTFLNQKKQLDLLLLEGAAGPLSADPLHPFEEGPRNQRFLEELSHRGLVNGAVEFFGTHPRTAVSGMEDPALYRQDLETYRSLGSRRDAIGVFLNDAEVSLIERTKRILDPRVLLFLKRWKLQQEKDGDFGDYLKFLLDYASQSLKIDWKDYSLQENWPQLVRLFYLLNAPVKQDASKLEKEIGMLRRSLGPEASHEMEWLQMAVKADALSAHDFRNAATPPRRMAERLVEKVQAKNLSWARYPALTRFLSLQIFQSEIVPEELFSEVQKLERKIFEGLNHNPQAGAWMEFYQDFYLLKRALSLELRREQIGRFREHFKKNWLEAYKQFLRKESLPQEKIMAPLVGKVLQFYAQAEAREEAFLSALSREMSAGDGLLHAQEGAAAIKHLAIVVGGYHREGLQQKMDRLQIPYGVITPRFETGENLLPYQKLLMGDYAEISTLGPAQLAVMPGRSEARNMVGDAAFENFWTALRKIKSSLTPQVPVSGSRTPSRQRLNFLHKIRPVIQILLLISVAGLLSGCANLGRGNARKQVESDRHYALPEREMSSSTPILVDESSLVEALVTRDPVILKHRFKVSIHEAEKGSLAGSISLMPTLGVADGKPVFGLGVEGDMPNLGAIKLTGLGVDSAATAVLALAAEIGKFWKGEDILARELAQQMVETAGLELQQATGERYLDFLGAAYEMKTVEAQGPIIEAALEAIHHAGEIAGKNSQSTAAERQAIEELKAEWLLRLNEYRSNSEKATFPLRTLYGQNALGSATFSNVLKYVEFPKGWTMTADQRVALGLKATAKSGMALPANRELAKAYQLRLSAATAGRLAQRRSGPSISLGGLSYFDSYGTKTPGVLKTKVVPEANERTYNQEAAALRGKGIFGGVEKSDREVALLEVRVAEADLLAVRDKVDERIAELLQTIAAENETIQIAEAENVRIDDYLKKARSSGVTEDRLITEALKIPGNQIRILSSRKTVTLAATELRVLTLDVQGLPRILTGRSEMRTQNSKFTYLKQIAPAAIGTAGFAAATLGLAFILKPHLQNASWHSFFLSLGVSIAWAGMIAAYCVWMQDYLRQGLKAFISKNYWGDVWDAALPAGAFAAFFTVYYALIGEINLSRWMNPVFEISLKTVVDAALNYTVFYPLILWKFFTEVYKERYRRESLKVFKTRPYFDESRSKLLWRFMIIEIGAMIVNKLVSWYLSELVILAGDIVFTWMALRMVEKIHQAGFRPVPEPGIGVDDLVRGSMKAQSDARSEMRSNPFDPVINTEMLGEALRRAQALLELGLSDSGAVRELAHHAIVSLIDGGLWDDSEAIIPMLMLVISLELMTSAKGATRIPEEQAMAAWALASGFIHGKEHNGGVTLADLESVRDDLGKVVNLQDTLASYSLAAEAIESLRSDFTPLALSGLTVRIRKHIELKAQESKLGIEEKDEASAIAAGLLMQTHRFLKRSGARSEMRSQPLPAGISFMTLWVTPTSKIANAAYILAQRIRAHWPELPIQVVDDNGEKHYTEKKFAGFPRSTLISSHETRDKNPLERGITFTVKQHLEHPRHPWMKDQPHFDIQVRTMQPFKYLDVSETVDEKAVLNGFGLSATPLVFANVGPHEVALVAEAIALLSNKIDFKHIPVVVVPRRMHDNVAMAKALKQKGIHFRLRKEDPGHLGKEDPASSVLILNSLIEQPELLKVAKLSVYGSTLWNHEATAGRDEVGMMRAHNLAESYSGVVTGSFSKQDLKGPEMGEGSGMAVRQFLDAGAVVLMGEKYTPEDLANTLARILSNEEELSQLRHGSAVARSHLSAKAMAAIDELLNRVSIIRSEVRTEESGGDEKMQDLKRFWRNVVSAAQKSPGGFAARLVTLEGGFEAAGADFLKRVATSFPFSNGSARDVTADAPGRSESRSATLLSVKGIETFGPETKVAGLVYRVDLGGVILEMSKKLRWFLNRGLRFGMNGTLFHVKTNQNGAPMADVQIVMGFSRKVFSWRTVGPKAIPDDLRDWLDEQVKVERVWTKDGFTDLLAPEIKMGGGFFETNRDLFAQRSEMRVPKATRNFKTNLQRQIHPAVISSPRDLVSLPASQIKSGRFSILRLWREQSLLGRSTSTDLMADDHLLLYKAGPVLGALCLPVLLGASAVAIILNRPEKAIAIFKRIDFIFMGAFLLLVGTFFTMLGFTISENHLKDVEAAQLVVRNTGEYVQDPSSAKTDAGLFKVVQKLEKDTGLKVVWTDHPSLLIKLDRKSRTLIMAIGWITQSGILGDQRRLGFLTTRLRHIRHALERNPINVSKKPGFLLRFSEAMDAGFLRAITGTSPVRWVAEQQRSEIRLGSGTLSRPRRSVFRSFLLSMALLLMFVPAAFSASATDEALKELKKQEAVLQAENQKLEQEAKKAGIWEAAPPAKDQKEKNGGDIPKVSKSSAANKKAAEKPAVASKAAGDPKGKGAGFFSKVSKVFKNLVPKGKTTEKPAAESEKTAAVDTTEMNSDLTQRTNEKVETRSVMEILLDQSNAGQKEETSSRPMPKEQPVEAGTPAIIHSPAVAAQGPALPPAATITGNAPTTEEPVVSHEEVLPEAGSSATQAAVTPAMAQTQESQDQGEVSSSQVLSSHGTVLYKETGQAVANPPQSMALKVPFLADKMSFSVKAGEVVEKGAPLARGIDTERENRIQFLKGRIRELQGLIATGRENPGTMDQDTAFRYQFELTEFSLETDRLTAEQDAGILLAPRPVRIQILPQGPATDSSMTVQVVPLDEAIITFPLSLEHFGFDDAVLSVNGKPVIVTDWEASGFDLAKGAKGEFNLRIHFISPVPVTQGQDELCKYDIALLRSHALDRGSLGVFQSAGFHTLVPPSQFVRAGVPSVPGVPAGVFHATVQDGQIMKEGDILGKILIPAAQDEQIRKAEELVRLAAKCRSANQLFPTLSESAVQEFEARAQRAKASVKREGSTVLVKAPVGGRVRGVTDLDGQMLALGRSTEAGVFSAEVFLGTSTDPRSGEGSDRLSNDDPHLISVEKGSVKKGDTVSVSTGRGVLSGTVYAVIPLANQGLRLYSGHDGIVVRVVDENGTLGVGSGVHVEFDGGRLAAGWARKESAPVSRLAPPLDVRDDIPPAIQQEFQKSPGQRIGFYGILKLVHSEGNIQQKFEMLRYFMNPLGFRYVNGTMAVLIVCFLGLWSLPKLVFLTFKHRKFKKFFQLDTEEALAEIKNELEEIESRLIRRASRQHSDPVRNPDAQVLREIVAPIQEWVKLVWDHEELGSDERDTITTKASELATNPLLRFSKEHFEELGEAWKNDTRYLVKIRGLLARLAILTGKTARRLLRTQSESGEDIESLELVRFQEKMADFAENFNEGYNLAHRLIALSQVIDLYPPTLKPGRRDIGSSEWREIVRNRWVTRTFPVMRFFLLISLMVKINIWVTLRSFKNVMTNMEKLGISGFQSMREAMRTAREGLHEAFHPVAHVDEVEGNKLDAYYGRWLGRVMVVVGVLIAIKFPLLLALLGLSNLIAPGAALFLQLMVPAIVIWRHIGPMLKRLNGDGYGVMKREIRALRQGAKKMNKNLRDIKPPQATQPSLPAPSRNIGLRDENLMMRKMQQALFDDELIQSVEVVVLLPPKHGENKDFFKQMTSQDEVLNRFRFTVAESDGLFPGNAGQFFAARDLAQSRGEKIQIYWFPQPDISFVVAMALFKVNLAEALRMVDDFKQHGMKFGEIIFPGGNLSSNAISYTKNGSSIVIDARLASLEEVERERHLVMLGRNGSPRHDVTHVVRRPEDLRGVLGQYGHDFGAGVSLANSIAPQFAVPKGPLALISNNPEDRERMETALAEFRLKIENLIGRYGPFPVDLLEDFASVIAEFHRQFLENNLVAPNLHTLADRQKTFPDAEKSVNPYAKIYGTLGQALWKMSRNQRQGSLKVEAFVPAPSDLLFVSGTHPEVIRQRIERMQKTFPELVNAMALEAIGHVVVSDIQDQVVMFDDNGSDIPLPKKAGYQRRLPARKVAAFVFKDGKVLFQRRSRQAASNAGLLDLSVVEHLEPGETFEGAVARGFREELLDGRPLPPSLETLPINSLGRTSYAVSHEKRKRRPTTRNENVSVSMVQLNGEFRMADFMPGDDAVEVVPMTPGEIREALENKHGAFTPRAYVMLNQYLPDIEKAMAPARAELRTIAPLPEVVLEAPERVRLLTAIKITERILGPNDQKLLPRLKALLEDRDFLSERTGPELREILSLSGDQFLQLQREMEIRRAVPQSANTINTLFLDSKIKIRDEHLLLLSQLPFRVVILFGRDQSSRKTAIEQKIKAMALPAGHFQLIETQDGASASISKFLRPLIAGNAYQRLDYAFIGTDRHEVQKVKSYVGNLVYYDKDLQEYDEDVLFSLLWYLVTSPQLFGLGKKRDICWGMKDAVMLAVELLVTSLRSQQAVKMSA